MLSRSPIRDFFRAAAAIVAALSVCEPAQAQEVKHLDATKTVVAQGLAQFRSSRSPNALRSTIYQMQGGLDIGELTPSNFVTARRELVQSWATIIAVTERSYDQSFNPQDPANIPQNCLIPPLEKNRRLPACADPKDISDPQVRATYEGELAKNDQVTRKWNTYQEMSQIDRLAMTSLKMQLDLLRKIQPEAAQPDFAALDTIVRNAGVSDDRRRTIDTFF